MHYRQGNTHKDSHFTNPNVRPVTVIKTSNQGKGDLHDMETKKKDGVDTFDERCQRDVNIVLSMGNTIGIETDYER